MRKTARMVLAYAAVVGLLLAGVSALAESFSAPGLPACCNTAYCPLHHRQFSDVQKDGSNCDALRSSKENDCSMRACDTTPSPVVEITPFVLVAPLVVEVHANVEPAPILVSRFFPVAVIIPSTPPPRTFPS